MYSEHLVARLLRLTSDQFTTGTAVDKVLGARVVTVGRMVGPMLGYPATDAGLAWVAARTGEEAAVGTRAAVHLLGDGRCALGLGPTRGLIETAGDRLTVVRAVDPARYTSAWYLPTVYYGGLL